MAQNPQDVAARWAARMGASGDKWQAGVDSVNVAPGQAAARQKNAYVQGVTNNVDKWATNVASVSLQEWKDAMINKGKPRIATGANAAQGKFADFMSALLPQIDRVRSTLGPRGDFATNVARMNKMVTGMHEWSYKR